MKRLSTLFLIVFLLAAAMLYGTGGKKKSFGQEDGTMVTTKKSAKNDIELMPTAVFF